MSVKLLSFLTDEHFVIRINDKVENFKKGSY